MTIKLGVNDFQEDVLFSMKIYLTNIQHRVRRNFTK